MASSITGNTERSLDSGFRSTTGTECLRLTPFGGEKPLTGGEGDLGGVADGDGVVVQSVDAGMYAASPLVPGSQAVILLGVDEGRESKGSRSGVPVKGLAVEEVVLVIMDRGVRILNIWSSDWGGPYESKGSGTVCNIGSMIGSEL